MSALCVYQSTCSSDTSRGWHAQTASMPRSSRKRPPGVAALASFHVSKVWPSHSTAFAAVHGASSGTCFAIALICWIALNGVRARPSGPAGSGPSGPLESYR